VKEEVVTVKLTFGNCNLNSSSMKYLALLILMYSENLYAQNTDSILYAKPKKYFKIVASYQHEARLDNYFNPKKCKQIGDTLHPEIVEYLDGKFAGIFKPRILISNAYMVREDNIAIPANNMEFYEKIISIYKQTLKKKK
jgi:hypothetical protein